jgi:ribosome-associated translation inhibitor RaiA
MKHQVEFKGLESDRAMRSLIESRIRHLEPDLPRASRRHVIPTGWVLRTSFFACPSRLTYLRRRLPFKQEAHDPEAAIRGAFQEIERQFEAYKSSIRCEHRWKRVERRREIERRKTGMRGIGRVKVQ